MERHPTGQPMSRRSLLLLGAAAAAGSWWPRRPIARAEEALDVRIGVVIPADTAVTSALDLAVRDAVTMGLQMAQDDLGLNMELFGGSLQVLAAPASGPEEAARQAERLASSEDICALAGGFDYDEAWALARVASAHGIPFLNIGVASDRLRGEGCSPFAFHVDASAAMYLDAVAAWFVRAGHRRWLFVYEATPEGRALLARARRSLTERHWGATEVGNVEVPAEEPRWEAALDAVRRSRPDVTLLLLEAGRQLDFLERYREAGLTARVTGFPYPQAQTRLFYQKLAAIDPTDTGRYRAALWETTLDAYGARELNARFIQRWSQPMEPSAWAAYHAVKIVCDAAIGTGSVDGPTLMAYMESQQSAFDVYKGIGVSFRPWDHQMRQPMYLVRVEDVAPDAADDLTARVRRATLVGELPEIYRPGTDPIERLDQLGDLRRDPACRWQA